jgi:hypothetical protein
MVLGPGKQNEGYENRRQNGAPQGSWYNDKYQKNSKHQKHVSVHLRELSVKF